MMKRRVAITGIGPVTSLGIGKRDFWDNLLAGLRPEFKRVPQDVMQTKSQAYIPFPEFNITDFGFPHYYDFLQPEDKLAIVGAKLALEDAGFDLSASNKTFSCPECSGASVVMGIGLTGFETAFMSYLAHLGIDHLSTRTGKKPSFNRMVIPQLMNNSPAAWISIIFGVKGESYTVNASCASGTVGLGQAYRKIADGYCELVIAGGVENLQDESFMTFRGFDTLGALTRSETADPQPFSETRSGFLYAEGGGCVLILEELTRAQKRGARIYAEVLAYHSNSDAYSIVHMEPDARQIIELFKNLTAGGRPNYMNAHGTATLTNDEIEAKAIIEFFGKAEAQPLINSTKGILGHTVGGSGAIEAAVTALSVFTNQIHSNRADMPIPHLNLASQTMDAKIERAISVSYGFGGHNAGLLLGKYHG